MAWRARVWTLFPEALDGLRVSLPGKALERGLWSLECVDLHAYGAGRHARVDGRPKGGGAGMVLRADVVDAALEAGRVQGWGTPALPVYHLSPRGRRWTQADAQCLSQCAGVGLLCGRYEGIDQRVLDKWALEELSLGDYVLAGGEAAACVVLECCVRLLPHVLGSAESVAEESFTRPLLEYPHYTNPRLWDGRAIPDVLLSGDHGAVARWRRKEAERLTRSRRPDLWRAYRGACNRS